MRQCLTSVLLGICSARIHIDAQEIFVQLTGSWMLFAADVREGASLWAVVVGPSDEMQKET